MNRRDLFRRIGGALCAAAMELGWREPDGIMIRGQWMEMGVRYDWVDGTGWVKSDKRFGDSNAWEPNPSYADSEE